MKTESRQLQSELRHLQQGINKIMATIEEINAKFTVADGKIDAVAADVKSLQDKIAAFPAPGLTPEQQAALDALSDHADAMTAKLAGIDESVNPPAA
jgi:uncharacterized coiled-coil protein SlyX